MNSKYLLLAMALVGSTMVLNAQNELDVYRYSLIQRGGTARFVSLGGAMGALGADFGAISVNPGALGVYRQGEAMATGNVTMRSVETSFAGESNSTDDAFFNFANAGIVFTSTYEDSPWKKVSAAIGYNRRNSFRQESYIEADYSNSSLLDQYVSQANGIPNSEIFNEQPFGAGLAWDTFLLNPDGENDDLYAPVIQSGTKKKVTRKLEERGAMGETVLGVGANYEDRLFIGGTLVLQSLRYSQENIYEEDVASEMHELDSFRQTSNLDVTGSAVSVSAGAIYRANEKLRLGGAVHSGMNYTLNDTYSSSIVASYNDGTFNNAESGDGVFTYRIKTPARYVASAAFIMGKGGFVSADYEFVDYTKSKIKPDLGVAGAYDYGVENQVVSQSFRRTHNVRVGAEWRIVPTLRVRAGASATQNPYKQALSSQSSTWFAYSAGLGFRRNQFFADVGVRFSERGQDVFLYDPALIEATGHSTMQTDVVFTIGQRLIK